MAEVFVLGHARLRNDTEILGLAAGVIQTPFSGAAYNFLHH